MEKKVFYEAPKMVSVLLISERGILAESNLYGRNGAAGNDIEEGNTYELQIIAIMKKYFKSLFVIVATSAALLACNKETPIQVGDDSDALVELTIIAHNPEAQPATKTEMVDTTPFWSVGDAIGVSDGTSSNNKFTANIEGAAAIASFKGSTTISGPLFAYYPYTSNGVGTIGEINGAKVDLPANQNPTATSFDGKADVMVAKQFTVAPENTVVEDLEFARLGAVVKIVLIDKNNTMEGTQHPSTVSMTAESALAGRVLIDMENQELNAPYHNQSSTVTANYTTETKYVINGSNATYLIVYPQTLAEGSTLTIAASTEDYTLSKEITVPSGGIELLPGNITLKINFAANNIISDSGANLPFNDDFSWQEGSGSSALSEVDDRYSAFSNVYPDKGAGTVRIGTSNATGYLTTKELNLSSAFYVIVSAYAFNAGDGSKIQVVVDGETSQTASVAMISTTDATDYIFNFSAATKKSKVTISTDKKRAVLTGVQIISGAYVFPPAINVTTNNPMAIGNTSSSQTIEYTIDNPTTANLTASTEEDWISNIEYPTSGKVTFDVAEQATGAEARTATITLSYPGAEPVTVTVNQAAGEASLNPSDCVTLDWSYPQGNNSATSSGLSAIDGVTTSGLGSDYAASNAPYQIKFDGTGDYIQIKTDSSIGKVSVEYKMIGGHETSKLTFKQSVDGETWTDVQTLDIAGEQNSTGVLTTSSEFDSNSRYVKIEFTKGSNVGIGGITISKPINGPIEHVATINFGSNNVKINSASVTGSDSEKNSWTITTEGTTSFTGNADYYQVGSGSKPATSITFTTTLPESASNISLEAKFGGFSGTEGDVSLKVGDSEIGTGSLNATNDVTVTSTSTGSGKVLTVTVTNIAKGVKCYYIKATYTNQCF